MAVNEKNGRAMGLLILNSNAMEYGFLPPQVFSYRTLGGKTNLCFWSPKYDKIFFRYSGCLYNGRRNSRKFDNGLHFVNWKTIYGNFFIYQQLLKLLYYFILSQPPYWALGICFYRN